MRGQSGPSNQYAPAAATNPANAAWTDQRNQSCVGITDQFKDRRRFAGPADKGRCGVRQAPHAHGRFVLDNG